MRKTFILLFAFFTAVALQAQERDIQFEWIEGFQKVDSRREIKIPDIPGYKALKGDFHSHTIFSDGIVMPSERIHEAWREGLDVIAITDHTTRQPSYLTSDYNTSFKMAESVAKRRGITLIPGIEYTKSEPVGHLNILFLKDANYYARPDITPDEALDYAGKEGAFVIYNHPGWPDKDSRLDAFHIRHLEKKNIRAMEAINGNEFYPVVLDYCAQYQISPFSNTDIHSPIYASFPVDQTMRNLTLVFAKENTEEAIKEAMFAGRTLGLANNTLVGNGLYISQLIRESLQVTNLLLDDYRFSCNVTNQSDITWILYGPGHRRYVFPAGRTVQLSDLLSDAELVYKVKNTWVASDRHLEIPLMYILAEKEEVHMPVVGQNLTLIDKDQAIFAECLTQGAEIRYTTDGSVPDQNAQRWQQPLRLNQSATLTLRAFKEGMKPSRLFRRQVIINQLHEPSGIKAKERGLNYQYYEGEILSVVEIPVKGKKISEGISESLDIKLAKADDHFGIIFTGYLYAPVSGLYTFALESDDGATFSISNVELLDNDGSHSLKRVEGKIQLKKGFHPITVRYFDDYEEQEIRLLWSIQGKPETEISPEYYFAR